MSKSQNSIEGEITFIYSLYHDHSIKRSVSSRDNRSSRSQHPHVVSRSPFVVIVEVVSGSRRDSNLRGLGSLQSRTSHLYLHFPRFVSFRPSFFTQKFLLFFHSFFLHSNKHVSLLILWPRLDQIILYSPSEIVSREKNFFISAYVKSYFFFFFTNGDKKTRIKKM